MLGTVSTEPTKRTLTAEGRRYGRAQISKEGAAARDRPTRARRGGMGKRAQRRSAGRRAQAGGISRHAQRRSAGKRGASAGKRGASAGKRGVSKRVQKKVAQHLIKAHVHKRAAKRILKARRRHGGGGGGGGLGGIIGPITGILGSLF